MNNYSPVASGGSTADAANIRAFLQQAVDDYPRLAVFIFTLKLLYREALNKYSSLFFRFHTEVWLRTGKYSCKRQQARCNSPPTILRWMWESVSAPECKMVLLMNLDTLGARCVEVVEQELRVMFREAWGTVTDADNSVTSMLAFIINRSDRCSFTQLFN